MQTSYISQEDLSLFLDMVGGHIPQGDTAETVCSTLRFQLRKFHSPSQILPLDRHLYTIVS